MRIIAGLHKNRLVKSTIRGKTIVNLRPTTARIRESVFNIIHSYLETQELSTEECTFLDLCCGTGMVGIEALSRGFAHACFVDYNRNCLQLVMENIVHIEQERYDGQISKIEKLSFSGERTFDIIFFDPPYKNTKMSQMLSNIKNFMRKNTLLILEISKDYTVTSTNEFYVLFLKKYGHCQLIGLRKL